MPADRVPSDADFERLLRQQYAPLCGDDDYRRLRRACGLGPVTDGETVTPSERTPAMTDQPTNSNELTVITGMLPGEQADDYCPTCDHWLGMPHHTGGQPCPPATGEETGRA